MTLDELISSVTSGQPDGSPLDHVGGATALASHLDELGDHLVGHFVDQARKSGASWTQIGQSIGVSKQAAQKRFVGSDSSMDRFTNRAKVVMLRAENEARDRGHDEVTSLHLLLGILSEWDGLAGQAIAEAGVTKEALLAELERALPAGRKPTVQQVPHSAGLKKVHELIVREALRKGHNYVGTEHILLGLLDLDSEPGAQLLVALGITKQSADTSIDAALERLR